MMCKCIKKFSFLFLTVILMMGMTISASAYNAYDVTFTGAVDATTRWGSPVKSGSSISYPTITSKWYEARTTGTSPHVGVDLKVGSSYDIVAVTAGTLSKVSDGATYNTHSLSTSKSGVY